MLIFAACRSPSSDRPPGYLVVGIESNPLQLDPRYATDANSVRIGNLIYNSLLRADQHIAACNPSSPKIGAWSTTAPIFSTCAMTSRFHDGRPLTAADVKFTYESILDPNSRSPKRGLLKPLHAIEQIGTLPTRFRLNAPHAPFVEQFTLGIVPAGSASREPSNLSTAAGSGPF